MGGGLPYSFGFFFFQFPLPCSILPPPLAPNPSDKPTAF